MNQFKEITTAELNLNVFEAVGKDWMLITAGQQAKVNTMTASWGGMGVMWGKDVAFAVIRPQRYTKEFVDAQETFSLSLMKGDKQTLGYLGSVSGRDEDKISKSKLTVAYWNGTPYFAEAHTVLVCKKLFVQPYVEQAFLEPALCEQWYPEKDYHTLYISEIVQVLVKK